MPRIDVVLATVPYRGPHLERLRAAVAPAELIRVRRDDAAGIGAALQRADVAILAGDLDERFLGAPRLRWVHCDHAGLNKSARPEVFQRALLDALRRGALAGAGLDTFAQEPLPADSPLWDAPRTLLTPHVTPQVPDRTARSLDVIEENVRRYRAGQPLLNLLEAQDVYTRG